jgi:hypothetical protein
MTDNYDLKFKNVDFSAVEPSFKYLLIPTSSKMLLMADFCAGESRFLALKK